MNLLTEHHRSIAAYKQLIDPTSAAKLRVVRMDGRLQFAVTARRSIAKGEKLWELLGIMPIDSNGLHSQLSEMAPRVGEKPRALIGPIRFLNHRCRTFNCEV